MANYSEPIVVQIVNDAADSVTKGGGGSRGNAGSLAALTGIVGLVAEILSLVKDAVGGVLKPVRSMLVGILKLVAQLLRPVADVILIGLAPILFILKPIIRMFNEVMRPFRMLAMDVIKQNPIAGVVPATSILLTGVITALSVVGLELVKTLVFKPLAQMLDGLMQFIAPVLNWFGAGIDTSKPITIVQDAVDNVFSVAQESIKFAGLEIAKGMARTMNVTVDGIDYTTSMLKAQNRLQASVNDLFNNIRVPNQRVTVDKQTATSSAGDKARSVYGDDFVNTVSGAASAREAMLLARYYNGPIYF